MALMADAIASNRVATECTDEAQRAELLNPEANLISEIELKVIRNELKDYKYSRRSASIPTTAHLLNKLLQSAGECIQLLQSFPLL